MLITSLQSPELVSKLDGHDYTVYAYDFSEYEIPLVGQGMLSWVLASHSPTPNAPANQSQTMITGRVCKNIMGLFSKGPKETLEVKLKLIPVPKCLQSEYVESMEKFRSLSKVMPPGFDPKEWSQFLKDHPEIDTLVNSQVPQSKPPTSRENSRSIESIHEILRQNSVTDTTRHFQPGTYSAGPSRGPSPSPSIQSNIFNSNVHEAPSRPASRNSVRSERPIRPRHESFDAGAMSDNATEDGPARKRAKVTKAEWKGRSTFGANADSLRVTASTAASIRNQRPGPMNPLGIRHTIEPPPRAPTPRPANMGNMMKRPRGRPSQARPINEAYIRGSAPSRYISPYADNPMSDVAVETADEDQSDAIGETPSDKDFPSSPPVPQYDHISPAPSSPQLPQLPYQSDSGFVSDMMIDQEDFLGQLDAACNLPLTSDVPAPAQTPSQQPQVPASTPCPRPQIPNQFQPWTIYTSDSRVEGTRLQVPTNDENRRRAELEGWQPQQPILQQRKPPQPSSPLATSKPLPPLSRQVSTQQQGMTQPSQSDTNPTALSQGSNNEIATMTGNPSGLALPGSRRSSLAMPTKAPASLNREHSLASIAAGASATSPPMMEGEGIPMNGAGCGVGSNSTVTQQQRKMSRSASGVFEVSKLEPGERPTREDRCQSQSRSGGGAKRKRNALTIEESIAAGQMPKYCRNCGEVQTSTWRKAYMTTYKGTPDHIELTEDRFKTQGAVTGFEIVCSEDSSNEPSYRVFKKTLQAVDQDHFETVQLCNPCGLWFDKYGKMRPSDKWNKDKSRNNNAKPKRSRKKKTANGDGNDDLPSEFMSEAGYEALQELHHPGSQIPSGLLPPVPGIDVVQIHAATVQFDQHFANAAEALRKAIQSSPAGARFLGTKESPIHLEPDLTPKPTRRKLFPSPRKEGEFKSLDGSPTEKNQQKQIRIQSGVSTPQNAVTTDASPANSAGTETEDHDKENCPPADGDDAFNELFEEGANPAGSQEASRIPQTPSKKGGSTFADFLRSPELFLKTPSSHSRSIRFPLTPRLSNENAQEQSSSETPFTIKINKMFPDFVPSSSPSVQLLLSGQHLGPDGLANMDWSQWTTTEDVVNMEHADFDNLFPDIAPSQAFLGDNSSPIDGQYFEVFEDPLTATSPKHNSPAADDEPRDHPDDELNTKKPLKEISTAPVENQVDESEGDGSLVKGASHTNIDYNAMIDEVVDETATFEKVSDSVVTDKISTNEKASAQVTCDAMQL
jgi:hypothetical protein